MNLLGVRITIFIHFQKHPSLRVMVLGAHFEWEHSSIQGSSSWDLLSHLLQKWPIHVGTYSPEMEPMGLVPSFDFWRCEVDRSRWFPIAYWNPCFTFESNLFLLAGCWLRTFWLIMYFWKRCGNQLETSHSIFLESMDYILDSSDHLDTQSNITEYLGAFQPMGVPPCRLSH